MLSDETFSYSAFCRQEQLILADFSYSVRNQRDQVAGGSWPCLGGANEDELVDAASDERVARIAVPRHYLHQVGGRTCRMYTSAVMSAASSLAIGHDCKTCILLLASCTHPV